MIKENLTTLKVSLSKLQIAAVIEKSSQSDASIVELTEDLKIIETTENLTKKEDVASVEKIKTPVEEAIMITENKPEVYEEAKPEKALEAEKPKEEKPVDEPAVVKVLDAKTSALKTELETAVASIKKARRPTAEVQAVEKILEASLEIVSDLLTDQKQLQKVIKSIQKAEASLVAKKTSDMILVNENLTRLEVSLSKLQPVPDTEQTQQPETTEPLRKEEQTVTIENLKTPEAEKKVSETKSKESKDVEPEKIETKPIEIALDAPELEEPKPVVEPKIEQVLDAQTLTLKTEIETTVASIKKARRPTPEIQAVEKVLEASLEIVSDLITDHKQLQKVIKSIQGAEASLVAKKTSDMILVKENLTKLEISFAKLKSVPNTQQTKQPEITEVSKKEDVAPVKISKTLEEEPKVPESKPEEPERSKAEKVVTKPIKTTADAPEPKNVKLVVEPKVEKVLDAKTLTLKTEIETAIVSIKKARRPTPEVQTVENLLEASLEIVSDLSADQRQLHKIIKSIQGAEVSLVSKKTSDMVLVKEKLAILNISLSKLQTATATESINESVKAEVNGTHKEIQEPETQKAFESSKTSTETPVESIAEPEKPLRRKRISEKADEPEKPKVEEIFPEKPLRRRKYEDSKVESGSEDSSRQSEPRRRESNRMPTFIARLTNRLAPENSILKLTCAVSEHNVTVRWVKDEVILNNSEKYSIESNHGVLSLEIKNATAKDAGQFLCIVSNKHGEIETSANVQIFGEQQQGNSSFTRNLKGESIHSHFIPSFNLPSSHAVVIFTKLLVSDSFNDSDLCKRKEMQIYTKLDQYAMMSKPTCLIVVKFRFSPQYTKFSSSSKLPI